MKKLLESALKNSFKMNKEDAKALVKTINNMQEHCYMIYKG